MSQSLVAPRRTRSLRPVPTPRVWATDFLDFGTGASTHAACLAHLRAKRGPTPAQQRQAHQIAVFQGLIAQERARLTPNVCLALPLAGRALVPTAVVRYQ